MSDSGPRRLLPAGLSGGFVHYGAIWLATAALFLLSPVIAHGSTNSSALLSMIPFAAVLALASVGQMFVIRQGGLDLSVPGMMSLAAVLVTQLPNGQDGRLWEALLLALVVGLVVGVGNGVIITVLGVTPLVATLGTNALLYGFIYEYTGGHLAASAAPALTNFVSGRVLGIPVTAVIDVILLVAVSLFLRKTLVGRRFELVGASPTAARALGLSVTRYQIGSYIAAALAYTAAGVILAGYVTTPSLTTGDAYLLPTIVAVILGGTALGRGSGSVVATAVGALFLQQLDQLVLTLGSTAATQNLIQAVILAVGMGARNARWRLLLGRYGKRMREPEALALPVRVDPPPEAGLGGPAVSGVSEVST